MIVAVRHKMPPLAAGLSTADPDSEFTTRLVARYPEGSPEADLEAELQREGFEIGVVPESVDDPEDVPEHGINPRTGRKFGKAVVPTGVFTSEAIIVNWRADSSGHIRAITGTFASPGL